MGRVPKKFVANILYLGLAAYIHDTLVLGNVESVENIGDNAFNDRSQFGIVTLEISFTIITYRPIGKHRTSASQNTSRTALPSTMVLSLSIQSCYTYISAFNLEEIFSHSDFGMKSRYLIPSFEVNT